MNIHPLAKLSHTTTAVGYGLVLAGGALGYAYNKKKGNRFETGFHAVGVLFCAFAIGVDVLAAISHGRDARAEVAAQDDRDARVRGDS
jgi:hypothetical protein